MFLHYWEEHEEVLRLLAMEIQRGRDRLFDFLSDIKGTESCEKLLKITTNLEGQVGIQPKDDTKLIQRFISILGIIIISFLLEPLFTELCGMSDSAQSDFLEDRIRCIMKLEMV